MTEPFSHEWIQVDGISTHLLNAGQGPSTVLLLHGGGTDSARLSWREVIGDLAANQRVIAPDWPGSGMSDRPDVEYTMDFYVNFLENLIKALDLQTFSLVGISLGGAAALGYALRSQEKIERMALVDSYGFMGKIPFGPLGYLLTRAPLVNELSWWSLKHSRAASAYLLRGIFADPKRITPGLVDEIVEIMQQPNAGRAWISFQRSEALPDRLRTNWMDRLPEIHVPVLLIHGEKDPLVPLQLAKEAQQRIPGSRLEVIPGCGHWPPRERPDLFNPILTRFLQNR